MSESEEEEKREEGSEEEEDEEGSEEELDGYTPIDYAGDNEEVGLFLCDAMYQLWELGSQNFPTTFHIL